MRNTSFLFNKNFDYIKNNLLLNKKNKDMEISNAIKYIDNYKKNIFKDDLSFFNDIDLENFDLLEDYISEKIDFKSILPFDISKNSNVILCLNNNYYIYKGFSSSIKINSINIFNPSVFKKLLKFEEENNYKCLNFFYILNNIFSNNGLYIYIPPNFILKEPIYILNFFSTTKNNSIVYPKKFFYSDDNSEVSIVDYYFNKSSNIANNINTIINLNTYSKMEYYYINNSLLSAFSSYSINVNQKKNSIFKSNVFSFAGIYNKNYVNIFMLGKKSESSFNGIKYLNSKMSDYSDFNVNHLADETVSTCYFRGLVTDFSKCTFKGSINIDSNVKHALGELKCNALVMSDSSSVTLLPKLNIKSYDVNCMHGATVGFVNEDIIKYMTTRGISREESIILFINLFLCFYIERNNFFYKIVRSILIKTFFI